MNQKFLTLTELIKSRRAVFPQSYEAGQIPDEILFSIVENASWAPNHKKTEPWRFVILKDQALKDLSAFLENSYKSRTTPEQFDPVKMKKMGEKPLQSSVVIAICIHRSPESLIPAWEETAAVACAVQNMWLSCTALEIGSYWSTPSAIYEMKDFLKLQEHESCLGLFYMGWCKHPKPSTSRKSVSEIMRILS
jgi:nitroreductase